MKITIITPKDTLVSEADKGENLLSLLHAKKLLIPADCGGRGICNKCKVKLISGTVDIPVKDGYFNSCQCQIKDDITIEVNCKDNTAFCLTDNIDNYSVNKSEGFGLAVDIGTTSLASYLVDLQSGKIIDSIGELNRQISFGSDVVSRISFSENNLDLLTDTINRQITEIKERFCEKYRISDISKTVICANNTMLHILCGKSPVSMGQAPFIPLFTSAVYAKDYITLPSASAYIGSDIVAGVLSCGMYDKEENSLIIDIGTNGEMVLKFNGKYYACATAAGPALEGGNIEMGMGGVYGAIDHITNNNGELCYSTIGGGEAKGICGSGLTDLICLLLSFDIIDNTGRLVNIGSMFCERIKGDKFYITDKVYISQKDIREFQLAKSAIRSGIEVLLSKSNCKAEQISKVYLAGGLGYYINKQNAVTVGLLPQFEQEKLVTSGNTAGKGAIMCLVNQDYIKVCENIADMINVIELDDGCFYEAFVNNMSFIK